MPKILKFLIGLGAVIVVCIILFWVLGLPWLAKWGNAKMTQKNPGLLLKPQPLPDAGINFDVVATTEKARGYIITFPWMGHSSTKDYGKNGVVFDYSNRYIFMSQLAPDSFLKELKRNPQNEMNLNNVFKGNPPKTDYEFISMMLDVTPQNFSWTMDKNTAARDGVLYFLKATFLPQEAKSGIFKVETPEFRGFQYGVPESPEKAVRVDLYSPRCEMKFTFREQGGSPPVIPQQDIDRIIQSLKPDPEAPAATEALPAKAPAAKK